MVSVPGRAGLAPAGWYPEVVPFGIQLWELFVLLLIVLLVFGPKRLPEMGRSLGRGMREFKDSLTGRDDRPELPPGHEDSTVVPAPTRTDEKTTTT
jgi:sec-independent protein translocase protein TatA